MSSADHTAPAGPRDATRSPERTVVLAPPVLVFVGFVALAVLLERWFRVEIEPGTELFQAAAAVVLVALAGYLALHAAIALRRGGTAVDPAQPTTALVDGGPFRITRNPMYLALVVLLMAGAVYVVSIWFLLAAIGLRLVLDRVAVDPEERYLEAKFGDRYRAYAARVRRWI